MSKKEKLFLLLSGLFLGSLTMLNILGITKFLDLSFIILDVRIPLTLSLGVLPYPITFLCTDLVSELYGKKRANTLVWVGLLLSFWVLLVVWVGDVIPGVGDSDYPVFEGIKDSTYACTVGSMIAYLLAQFIDVRLFHFFKTLTKGGKLWLRNNGSTMLSQLVDTVAVVMVVYLQSPDVIPVESNQSIIEAIFILIVSMYLFKFVFALLDTIPFYFLVPRLKKYIDD